MTISLNYVLGYGVVFAVVLKLLVIRWPPVEANSIYIVGYVVSSYVIVPSGYDSKPVPIAIYDVSRDGVVF